MRKSTKEYYEKSKEYYKKYNRQNKKPKNPNLKPKLRKCLGNLTHKCLVMFKSEDIGQRICRPCKETKEWKSSAADTHNLSNIGF